MRSQNFDSLLGQDFVKAFGDFLIQRRADLVQKLNHGHIGPEPLVHRSQFQTDDSTADDGQVFGNFGDRKCPS